MSNVAELEYTPAVAAATQSVYERVKSVIPEFEWPVHAPYVDAINKLKRERNAVILAHNYMTPEIFHGVADIVGDSLIVLAGVHFMAETAKLLSPEKTVLMPDMAAGCSLASSITAADVRLLREKYPGVPVVTYVNTSADVKAESDVCCTSGNAVKIVESLGTDKVICLPDQYLARYIASQTDVEVIYWEGSCEVHERFTGAELRDYRKQFKDIVIVAHPECPQDVLKEADFVGSTANMVNYVGEAKPERVLLVTECSMSDNVAVEHPNVEFIRPCNLCPHMKLITLPKILDALTNMEPRVEVDPEVAERARLTVERMLAYS
jgi:quinolinate synthase